MFEAEFIKTLSSTVAELGKLVACKKDVQCIVIWSYIDSIVMQEPYGTSKFCKVILSSSPLSTFYLGKLQI